MSKARQPTSDDSDAWQHLADNRDTLQMLIDEETPLANTARELLAELDRRGY